MFRGSDGTVVIGATQREDALAASGPEDGGGAAGVSAGGVYQLLRDAQVLVPAVAELELLESTARARPATPDNAPLLGRVQSPGPADTCAGLIVATGFFRHGVLLAPAAAAICRDLMDGRTDPRWLPFSPARFSGQRTAIVHTHQGNSMNITLNGTQHAVSDGASITTLVSQVTGRPLAANGQATDGQKLGVAVAHNSEVVPRSQWYVTALAEGDDVELVTAVQGG